MKRMITGLLVLCMALTMFLRCAAQQQVPETTAQSAAPAPEIAPTVAAQEAPAAPKYVFLFIGDGMSYPQFQAAADYLGAIADGGLKKVAGNDKDKTSLYDLADSDSMSYDMDRANGEWALSDYVAKGIEVLNNDKGFFMMCEGGKIDWACHANDAGATVTDTLAMADAVQVAVDFAKEHPEETLILVTGDHETGGLTIGFAGTDYDTYLDTLANQTISYAQFDEQYVKGYKENGTSFEDAMKDVETLFGLKLTGEENDRLVLTEYETQRLRTAYDLAMSDYNADDFTQEQYVLYGTYNPFSVTVTHILNNKAGVDFTSYSHTGLPVAVFADGIGAEDFGGYYDNTEIYNKLANLLEVR